MCLKDSRLTAPQDQSLSECVEMRFALVVMLLPAFGVSLRDFDFPKPTFEVFSPRGFKVSIPDVEGSTLFAVHINVNEEMEGLEAGEFAVDIVKKKEGRWSYRNKTKRLRNGDKLYFWLYLIVDGLGYRLDDQIYVVSGLPETGSSPSGGSAPAPPVVDPPTGDPDIDIRVPCTQSQTQFRGSTTCSGKTLFYDDFSNGLSRWSHDVRFSDSPESDFTIWTKEFDTSGVESRQFFIEPKLLEDVTNETFVRTGTLDLKGCSVNVRKYCQRSGSSWSVLPPIVSSRITTKNAFSFLYGEVEIRAKLPSGDWLVPELWLEPKEVFYGTQSGRLFLGKAVGNPSLRDAQGYEIGSSRLVQGYYLDATRSQQFTKSSPDGWSSGFHTYKLRWAPDELVFYVDDAEIGRESVSGRRLNPALDSSHIFAPFDREFYLSIGLHAGGRIDFPDDSVSGGKAKPWGNQKVKHVLDFWQRKGEWFPSWRSPNNRLVVEFVKVTAL